MVLLISIYRRCFRPLHLAWVTFSFWTLICHIACLMCELALSFPYSLHRSCPSKKICITRSINSPFFKLNCNNIYPEGEEFLVQTHNPGWRRRLDHSVVVVVIGEWRRDDERLRLRNGSTPVKVGQTETNIMMTNSQNRFDTLLTYQVWTASRFCFVRTSAGPRIVALPRRLLPRLLSDAVVVWPCWRRPCYCLCCSC